MGERELEISIVIRCCDDWSVLKCIESIDENVDIVVSMCYNQELEKQIREFSNNVQIVNVPKGNLSITSNRGMDKAKFQKVIDIDSDTIFIPGTINEIDELLNNHEAVNVKIVFEHNGKGFSRLVALARQYVNSKDVFFTPGIAYQKAILPKIGNKLFNEQVPFAVDAELNFRINQNQINYTTTKGGITHKEEKVSHDLKSAFRIGKGCRLGKLQLNKENLQIIPLKVVRFSDYKEIIKTLGLKVLIYQMVWDCFFYTGYFIQTIKK
ncbi:MAG: hypothetical protein INQ03_23870 [Candidatus Heimdallarchaeota archaeon]|nr:hypothetical protein [Candidatus Heimdallarchaeota archaeon]